MKEVRLNDIGVEFLITIKDLEGVIVDLSTVTVKRFDFVKPSGTYIARTPDFYTDGTDGILKYLSINGDLDQEGIWQLQAHIEFSSTSYTSTITKFRVTDILSD